MYNSNLHYCTELINQSQQYTSTINRSIEILVFDWVFNVYDEVDVVFIMFFF